MSNPGSIRVVSKRKDGLTAFDFETIVDVDRSNPILSNRHILNNHLDDAERDRVIENYNADLQKDIAENGPMLKEMKRLAELLASGTHLALRCWCAPRRCHGEPLAAKIAALAGIDYQPPARSDKETRQKRQMGLF